MKGKYILEVYSPAVRYSLVLERQVTVISGNSGTGKTSFVDSCRQLIGNKRSPVKSNYKGRILVLEPNDNYWESKIADSKGCFIVADEGCDYIRYKQFAEAVSYSDNYFILISRSPLHYLTYSVRSVCELVSNRKGVYQSVELRYRVSESDLRVHVDTIVTEDSNSGCEMYKKLLSDSDIKVESARGKDNVCNYIRDFVERFSSKSVCSIVDGSAFGNQLMDYMDLMKRYSDVYLMAPESFEYLLLKSKVFRIDDDLLEKVYDYCDSVKYISWEGYFTDLLVSVSRKYKIPYNKGRLNSFYLSNRRVCEFFLRMLSDEFII